MAAATLSDLQTAISDGGLRNRVVAALCKTAVAIKFEGVETPNHTNRIAWAKAVLSSDANTIAGQVIKYVVAAYNADHANDDSTALLAMTDTQVQDYCNAAADIFADQS